MQSRNNTYRRSEVPRQPFEIKKNSTVLEIEEALSHFRADSYAFSDQTPIRLASDYSGEVFSDVWSTICFGTIFQELKPTSTVLRGVTKWSDAKSFRQSLSGIAAMQMAQHIQLENGVVVERDEMDAEIAALAYHSKGLLGGDSGRHRTLVEFDPQFPQSSLFSAETKEMRTSVFRDEILKWRTALEIGNLGKQIPVISTGAIDNLTNIFLELYENSVRYTSGEFRDKSLGRRLRFFRLRKLLLTTPSELLRQISSGAPARSYFEQQAKAGTTGIVEAIISDFGEGIVDHFLRSPRGTIFSNTNRRELLNRLVHSHLSSSGDSGAGDGILKALRAAQSIGAYVSLRTGEFWLHRDDFTGNLALTPAVDHPLPRVAGTHWQFIWSQGI